MTESTRAYAVLLVCFLLMVIVWSWVRPTVRGGVGDKAVGYQIDVNTADASTLELLPGVGPSIAENIVIARRESGGFQGPTDLESVRYIGPKLVARIEAWTAYGAHVRRPADESE